MLALGSNRAGFGVTRPTHVLHRALERLEADAAIDLVAVSRIRSTDPVGPSRRRFANAAASIVTPLAPLELLALCKALERDAGRRTGQRWAARPLDVDIVLWSDGMFAAPTLAIPHPAFRARSFVLDPVAEVAPDWRDPVTRHTMRQLAYRAARRRAVHR